MSAKPQAKGNHGISPSMMKVMKEAAKTPPSQYLSGTHATVRALGKASRKKK